MKKIFLILYALTFLISNFVSASVSNGTIETANKVTKICKNVSCSEFGVINWKPTLNGNTTGATAVAITDSGLSGYLWGDEIGWVNLDPTGAGVVINPSTGALSGTAYASVGGWINFNPTGSGVTLVDNGDGSSFSGYAYVSGINGGWMKFDCVIASTCVKTDWRTTSNRVTDPGGGDGGGGGGQIITEPGPGSEDEAQTPPSSSPSPALPSDAYDNFPGTISGPISEGGGRGQSQSQGRSQNVNDFLEGGDVREFPNNFPENIDGTKPGLNNSNPSGSVVVKDTCSWRNLSCLWESENYIWIFISILFLILLLLGRWGWKRFRN
ncbi:MAG: hypothetical protein M3Q24_01590 [bacterium]|nr:hypothetical protein [bacterium]